MSNQRPNGKIDANRFSPSREQDERLVASWNERGGNDYRPPPGDLTAQQVHRKMKRAVAAARKRLKESS